MSPHYKGGSSDARVLLLMLPLEVSLCLFPAPVEPLVWFSGAQNLIWYIGNRRSRVMSHEKVQLSNKLVWLTDFQGWMKGHLLWPLKSVLTPWTDPWGQQSQKVKSQEGSAHQIRGCTEERFQDTIGDGSRGIGSNVACGCSFSKPEGLRLFVVVVIID